MKFMDVFEYLEFIFFFHIQKIVKNYNIRYLEIFLH